jgi:Zn-dependent peptidase ImmA (M78 family)
MSRPEDIANHVLDRLNIRIEEDLLLLDEIVNARGALIHESSLEGSEARLLIGLGKPIISISSSPSINPLRRRFSIVHELGHLELHRSTSSLRSCTKLDIQERPLGDSNNPEQEANQFASTFLLPARFVEQPFTDNEPSFDLISEWAEKLQTSLTATALRFTHFAREPIAVVYSYRGKLQYFQSSSKFMELGVFPKINQPVGLNTGAMQLFNKKEVPRRWQVVRAAEWFRDDKSAFDRCDTIKEWSIGMPNYEAVLSLLWVNEPLGLNDSW